MGIWRNDTVLLGVGGVVGVGLFSILLYLFGLDWGEERGRGMHEVEYGAVVLETSLLAIQFANWGPSLPLGETCVQGFAVGRVVDGLKRVLVEIGAAEELARRVSTNTGHGDRLSVGVLGNSMDTCLYVSAVVKVALQEENIEEDVFRQVMHGVGEEAMALLFGGDEEYGGGWCGDAENIRKGAEDALLHLRSHFLEIVRHGGDRWKGSRGSGWKGAEEIVQSYAGECRDAYRERRKQRHQPAVSPKPEWIERMVEQFLRIPPHTVAKLRSEEAPVDDLRPRQERLTAAASLVHHPGCLPSAPWRCNNLVPMARSGGGSGEKRKEWGLLLEAWELISWVGEVGHPERPFFLTLHPPNSPSHTQKKEDGDDECVVVLHVDGMSGGKEGRLLAVMKEQWRKGLAECETIWYDVVVESGGKEEVGVEGVLFSMLRDPVSRAISWSGRRRIWSEDHPSRPITTLFPPQLESRGFSTSMGSPIVKNASVVGTEHARVGFWVGITEYFDLSFCVLAIQLRHPQRASLCKCRKPKTLHPYSLNPTQPQLVPEEFTTPITTWSNTLNTHTPNSLPLPLSVTVQDLKAVTSATRRQRVLYADAVALLWQRANTLRSVFPILQPECLAFGYGPAGEHFFEQHRFEEPSFWHGA